jgi:hypothetical protein
MNSGVYLAVDSAVGGYADVKNPGLDRVTIYLEAL